MFPAMEKALFGILESEADDKYYLWIEEENKFAEEPAFIICSGAFAKLGKHSFTVYMGHGLADWTFKKHAEAQSKVLECISKSKKPFRSFKHLNHKGKVTIYDSFADEEKETSP